MTYRQLGERLRRGEGDDPGRVESRLREEGKRAAALRCVVAERSKVGNVVVLHAFVKVVRWICPSYYMYLQSFDMQGGECGGDAVGRAEDHRL